MFTLHKPEWLGFTAQNGLPAMYQQLDWVPRISSVIRPWRSGARTLSTDCCVALGPVEQPTTFDFHVNSTTAAALGLTIPEAISVQVTSWFT
jgi:hypothetical protein